MAFPSRAAWCSKTGIVSNNNKLATNAFISNVTKNSVSYNVPAGNYSLKIFNLRGSLVANQAINGGQNSVKLSKTLAKGQYIFNITGMKNAVNMHSKLLVR